MCLTPDTYILYFRCGHALDPQEWPSDYAYSCSPPCENPEYGSETLSYACIECSSNGDSDNNDAYDDEYEYGSTGSNDADYGYASNSDASSPRPVRKARKAEAEALTEEELEARAQQARREARNEQQAWTREQRALQDREFLMLRRDGPLDKEEKEMRQQMSNCGAYEGNCDSSAWDPDDKIYQQQRAAWIVAWGYQATEKKRVADRKRRDAERKRREAEQRERD